MRFIDLNIDSHLLFLAHRPVLCTNMRLPHIRIKRAAFQEFLLLSAINNLSFLQNDNLICVLNGRQTMCNHQQGFPLERAMMDFWILSSFCGSVKAVASSKITIGAFFRIALAIAIRCFSPPESRLPASPAGVSYPFSSRTMKSSQQAAFAAAYLPHP